MRNLVKNKTGRRLTWSTNLVSRFDNFFNNFEKEFFGKYDTAFMQKNSDLFSEFLSADDLVQPKKITADKAQHN